MGKITIARLLISFATIVVLGLVTSIGLQTYTLSQLKVKGPVYNGIIDSKDLVADILPPPLYLVEAYMLASEAVLDPPKAARSAAAIKKLAADYQQRRDYWQTSALPQALKRKLAEDVVVKGDAFWETYNQSFGQTNSAADVERSKKAILELGQKFWAHDAAVRELVEMANAHLLGEENRSAVTATSLERLAVLGSVTSVA
ncbi:MAG: methyl-accepting chemotaxis serine transducer [Rhizobium sp.]|nr:methyl-accepting chemotaxis serine transducer [Rhizobium sp.]